MIENLLEGQMKARELIVPFAYLTPSDLSIGTRNFAGGSSAYLSKNCSIRFKYSFERDACLLIHWLK